MSAAIAQLGERQTEDLKVPGSITGLALFLFCPWPPPCVLERCGGKEYWVSGDGE